MDNIIRQHKAKVISNILKSTTSTIDVIQKAKALPIGTIKKRPNGMFIKTANGWKYHSPLPSSGADKKESVEKELEKLDKVVEKLPPVSVQDRWDSYETFIDMVIDGLGKSAISYGIGGVGKTYTVTQALKRRNLQEYLEDVHLPGSDSYDYIKITGKSTATAMYKALYEHNGKLIIFDDCDSVLLDPTSVNILKGALDTTGDGTISYGSAKKIKDSDGEPVPQRFSFNGKVIFISNLPAKDMPQPLRSRSLTINLSMTAKETIERMRTFIDTMPFQDNHGNPIQVNAEDRKAAIDFLDENSDKIDIGDLNARTLGQIALIKKKVRESNSHLDWKKVAIAMLHQ